MHEPFAPTTKLAQLQAQGHRQRKGHTLTGYYVPTTTRGVVRLVKTCCGETSEPAPIICDYCDQPATRVEQNGITPLCPRCARDHYGTDWRTETLTLGIRARRAIEEYYSDGPLWH